MSADGDSASTTGDRPDVRALIESGDLSAPQAIEDLRQLAAWYEALAEDYSAEHQRRVKNATGPLPAPHSADGTPPSAGSEPAQASVGSEQPTAKNDCAKVRWWTHLPARTPLATRVNATVSITRHRATRLGRRMIGDAYAVATCVWSSDLGPSVSRLATAKPGVLRQPWKKRRPSHGSRPKGMMCRLL